MAKKAAGKKAGATKAGVVAAPVKASAASKVAVQAAKPEAPATAQASKPVVPATAKAAAPGPANAPAVKAPVAPAVASRTEGPSAGNLAVAWSARADGSAELVVAYEGPLAGRDHVLARAGTWRQGAAPWAETVDVELRREGPSRWIGAIPVRAGAPVEAVELVFRAGDEWDNGGRAPLGYYEWSVGRGAIDVR